MFADEMESIERRERRDSREERRLIPIDSCSQLDTGYTGRYKEQRIRQLSAIAERRGQPGFSLCHIENPTVLKQFCAHNACTKHALFYLVYRRQQGRPSLYRRCAEHAQQDARNLKIEPPDLRDRMGA